MGAWRAPREHAAALRPTDIGLAGLATGGAGALAYPLGLAIDAVGGEPFESIGLILAGSTLFLGPSLAAGLIAAYWARRLGLIGPASALTAGGLIGGAAGLAGHMMLGFGSPVERAMILPCVGALIGAGLGLLFRFVLRALRPEAFTSPQ